MEIKNISKKLAKLILFIISTDLLISVIRFVKTKNMTTPQFPTIKFILMMGENLIYILFVLFVIYQIYQLINKKRKKILLFLSLIFLLTIFLSLTFYWYEYRTTLIRKNCAKSSMVRVGKNHGKILDKHYKDCLLLHGFKINFN